MIEFLQNNCDWLFSGIGSGVIFWLIGHQQGYKKAIKQNQKVGDKSTAVQVGGDYHQTNSGNK
jgi:hypothetical protein